MISSSTRTIVFPDLLASARRKAAHLGLNLKIIGFALTFLRPIGFKTFIVPIVYWQYIRLQQKNHTLPDFVYTYIAFDAMGIMRAKIVERKILLGMTREALDALERRLRDSRGKTETAIILDLIIGKDHFCDAVEKFIDGEVKRGRRRDSIIEAAILWAMDHGFNSGDARALEPNERRSRRTVRGILKQIDPASTDDEPPQR